MYIHTHVHLHPHVKFWLIIVIPIALLQRGSINGAVPMLWNGQVWICGIPSNFRDFSHLQNIQNHLADHSCPFIQQLRRHEAVFALSSPPCAFIVCRGTTLPLPH
jgi:hypothetical protein